MVQKSENEKIDDLIQEMRLKIGGYNEAFEWIPYHQFNKIREIGNGGFAITYSATWNKRKIALKCLNNSQNLLNELLNEV